LAIQQIVNLWAIYIYVVENCFWHIKSENYINQLLHSTKAKHEKKKKTHTHLQPELLLLIIRIREALQCPRSRKTWKRQSEPKRIMNVLESASFSTYFRV
jgi:hypothetical protein